MFDKCAVCKKSFYDIDYLKDMEGLSLYRTGSKLYCSPECSLSDYESANDN